jgi:hypothetical protein
LIIGPHASHDANHHPGHGGTAHKNPYHIGGRFGDFANRGSCDENCPSKPDGPDTRNAIWVRNNLESLKLSPCSDPNAEAFSLYAILDKSRRQVLGSFPARRVICFMAIIYPALGNFGDDESPEEARLHAPPISFGMETVRRQKIAVGRERGSDYQAQIDIP